MLRAILCVVFWLFAGAAFAQPGPQIVVPAVAYPTTTIYVPVYTCQDPASQVLSSSVSVQPGEIRIDTGQFPVIICFAAGGPLWSGYPVTLQNLVPGVYHIHARLYVVEPPPPPGTTPAPGVFIDESEATMTVVPFDTGNSIPTLSPLSLAALSALLFGAGLAILRRRRR